MRYAQQNGRQSQICLHYSADEYTLQFMENNCRNYSMANWQQALTAAKAKITGALEIPEMQTSNVACCFL